MVVWKCPTNVEIPRHVWWFQPSEKYESQLGLCFPIYGTTNQENVGNTYERLRTARILSKASRTKDGKVRLHELQRSLKRMALQKHGKRALSNTMGQLMNIPPIFLWFMMVYDTYNYSSWIFIGYINQLITGGHIVVIKRIAMESCPCTDSLYSAWHDDAHVSEWVRWIHSANGDANAIVAAVWQPWWENGEPNILGELQYFTNLN